MEKVKEEKSLIRLSGQVLESYYFEKTIPLWVAVLIIGILVFFLTVETLDSRRYRKKAAYLQHCEAECLRLQMIESENIWLWAEVGYWKTLFSTTFSNHYDSKKTKEAD